METTTAQAYAALAFMAAVTCYLLGRVFAGADGALEVLVYGATAAFGLEFLAASWRSLWSGAAGRS